jgi:hypothetical protein
MHVYTIRAKITLNPTRQHKLSQKVRGEHPLEESDIGLKIRLVGAWTKDFPEKRYLHGGGLSAQRECHGRGDAYTRAAQDFSRQRYPARQDNEQNFLRVPIKTSSTLVACDVRVSAT